MKVAVLTSDTHNWLLQGFFHQWKKYGAKNGILPGDFFDIEVAGFTKQENLPAEIPFYSIGKFEDYPVEKWSDALIKYLHSMTDDIVMILLEDYWMMRQVNRQAIFAAYGYMKDHPEVARFDLAADRMFSQGARFIGSYGPIDLCEVKRNYSLSFQASLWRREILLDLLRPGETPWQAELNGSDRLNKLPYGVIGTYQWPMNYFIAMNKGKMDRSGDWMYPARTLSDTDWKELDALGFTQAPGEAV